MMLFSAVLKLRGQVIHVSSNHILSRGMYLERVVTNVNGLIMVVPLTLF